jgi:hypothetical protein
MVQAFVCCSDPAGQLPACPVCETTQWLGARHRGTPADAPRPRPRAHQQQRAQQQHQQRQPWAGPISTGQRWSTLSIPVNAVASPCGFELGRWATPFRRRGGEWVTDITPLRGLLVSDTCRFTLQAPPWAGTWVPSLSLRFVSKGSGGGGGGGEGMDGNSSSRSGGNTSGSDSGGSSISGGSSNSDGGARTGSGLAVKTLPLFAGGVLDGGYNARHTPITFATPPVSAHTGIARG